MVDYFFFFSSRRRHTRCALVTGVQTCALPISKGAWTDYSNTTRAPGYTLLGLSAEAVVRDGVTLFLDARNLTGKKAVGDISAVIMSDTATVAYYPVERRDVYGGVHMTFCAIRGGYACDRKGAGEGKGVSERVVFGGVRNLNH